MSADDTKKRAALGVFLVGGLVIMLAGMASVGMLSGWFSDEISVTAAFDTVDGLKEGDRVWFSGVPVGKVESVALADAGMVKVQMSVPRDDAAAIPPDVVASIGSDGLIGNRIVQLVDGDDPRDGHLADGDELEVEPYLSTDELMAQFQDTNRELMGIAKNVNTASRRMLEGEGTIGQLIVDDQLYHDAEAAVTTLSRAAVQAERMTRAGARYTAALNEPGTLPYALAHDESLTDSLTRTAGSMEKASTDLELVATDVRRATSSSDTPLGVLMHDRSAGADVEGTLADLHDGSELLAENLEAMQHNFLLRPFFKKKARAEAQAAAREGQARSDVASAPRRTGRARAASPRSTSRPLGREDVREGLVER